MIQTKKFLIINNLSKKATNKPDYSTKISEIENKIPSFGGLVATCALNVVKNKMPEKKNYKTKTSEIEKKLLIMVMINILLLQNLTS